MKKILFTVLTLVVSSYANAGLLVEPHVGYDMTRVVRNLTATPWLDSGFKTNAPNFGLRLGYKLPLMVWFAADVDYATGKMAFNDTATYTTNYNFTRTDLYAVVGIDLPLFLRGWVGYGFSSKIDVDVPGSSGNGASGNSLKGGIGLRMIPMMSLNAEYVVRTMVDDKTAGTTTKVSSTYATYKDVGAIFSISLPLNL